MSKLLLPIIAIFSIFSCSSVRFYSSAKTPASFEKLDVHNKKVTFVIEREFYLFGLIPGQTEIDLSREAIKNGYGPLSNVVISEKMEIKHWLWPIITFGFYIPRDFEVTANTNSKYIAE